MTYNGLTKLYSSGGLQRKEYQEKGVSWMVQLETKGKYIDNSLVKGGLLADEMGLGKTIQILGLICSNPLQHTLIVLPRALLEQWYSAILKFTKHSALIYHSSGSIPLNKISSFTLSQSPIVLTTYGMLNSYILQSTKWNRIVFDEAHHLRNSKNKTFSHALNIQSPIKWLVTGTPIQNKRQDFYSLCRIIGIPETFYIDTNNASTLAKLFILKRTKKQVGIELPPLKVNNIKIDWKSDAERDFAEDIHDHLSFSNTSGSGILGSIDYDTPLPFLTYARQSCILPSLLRKRMEQYVDDNIIDNIDELDAGLNGTSKMDTVLNTIISRKSNQCGKIIFCHYRGEIDYIKDALSKHDLVVESFDGRVSQKDREKILTKHCDILILQIKTGCEGLNLQQFSEVYFISPHWNPAIEDQAVARCHRIGQDKPVNVFRFNMGNLNDDDLAITIDQYTQNIQNNKRTIMSELE